MPARRLMFAFLRALSAIAFLASAIPALAQSEKTDYSLFNPTPRESMRAMVTDRPDLTESPYTVDAGHIQLEMDLWNHAIDRVRDGGSDLRTTQTAYAPINMKIGLTNAIDLQIVVEPYLRTTTRDLTSGAIVDKNHGIGDVTTRLKLNIWGDDGGKTAFAIMPFVKIPTNSNNLGNRSIEGGVILPLAIGVAKGIDIGLMTEVDVVRNSADTGYTAAFVNTATVGFELSDRIGMYSEIATSKTVERASQWDISFDTGLTYALTDNMQLDAGINIGLTKAAVDLVPFVGLSWRF